MPECQIPA